MRGGKHLLLFLLERIDRRNRECPTQPRLRMETVPAAKMLCSLEVWSSIWGARNLGGMSKMLLSM
jgi:hypothetical protein